MLRRAANVERNITIIMRKSINNYFITVITNMYYSVQEFYNNRNGKNQLIPNCESRRVHPTRGFRLRPI